MSASYEGDVALIEAHFDLAKEILSPFAAGKPSIILDKAMVRYVASRIEEMVKQKEGQ